VKTVTTNEITRILRLAAAAGPIRLYRDGGLSWADIVRRAPKTCNPLGLSERQLSRIYEGKDRYRFDILKKTVSDIKV